MRIAAAARPPPQRRRRRRGPPLRRLRAGSPRPHPGPRSPAARHRARRGMGRLASAAHGRPRLPPNGTSAATRLGRPPAAFLRPRASPPAAFPAPRALAARCRSSATHRPPAGPGHSSGVQAPAHLISGPPRTPAQGTPLPRPYPRLPSPGQRFDHAPAPAPRTSPAGQARGGTRSSCSGGQARRHGAGVTLRVTLRLCTRCRRRMGERRRGQGREAGEARSGGARLARDHRPACRC
jgi:hypothetical protein